MGDEILRNFRLKSLFVSIHLAPPRNTRRLYISDGGDISKQVPRRSEIFPFVSTFREMDPRRFSLGPRISRGGFPIYPLFPRTQIHFLPPLGPNSKILFGNDIFSRLSPHFTRDSNAIPFRRRSLVRAEPLERKGEIGNIWIRNHPNEPGIFGPQTPRIV